MPNGTTSIIIYCAFDIHDKNQGREGLRGNFPLLSIWGGRGVDGKQFFLEGRGGGCPPKKKEGYPSLHIVYMIWALLVAFGATTASKQPRGPNLTSDLKLVAPIT